MRLAKRLVAGLALATAPVAAAPGPVAGSFVTLGTAGGPVAYAERSQPANWLVAPGGNFLVDAGDGASERLAAAGLQPRAVNGVFLSHLHIDHVGGLQGLIGLRWMLETPDPLTVYGPAGTQALVDGILASLAPSARIGLGFGRLPRPPEQSVRVVILDDGADLSVAGMRVRAVRNSHYSVAATGKGSEPASLSYRFDLPGRSIGYTGDTGPSDPVASLFQGVDLLVSEVVDLPRIVADARRQNIHLPEDVQRELEAHLAQHHLTPDQAGALAARAKAKRLVLTHLAIVGPTSASEASLVEGARSAFKGPVAVARDLDRF